MVRKGEKTMISHCPADHELATMLHVPQDIVATVLDKVALDFMVWKDQRAVQSILCGNALTYVLLYDSPCSTMLAFLDPADIHHYLPEPLISNLEMGTLSFRALLSLLLL